MRRLIVLLLLAVVSFSVIADAMQERRVSIAVSIFPRIIAVDDELKAKVDSSGVLNLAIVYGDGKVEADKVAAAMNEKFAKIGSMRTSIESFSISELGDRAELKLAGIFIMEPMDDAQLRKLITYGEAEHIIIFSPFDGDVERGVAAGIHVAAKIRPYFNMGAIRLSGLRLKPAIFNVSKIYE